MIPQQHDFAFLFGNYLATTMILVTMIPSTHENVYYQFVELFSVFFKLLLSVYILVSFLDEQNAWIHWQVRHIHTDYWYVGVAMLQSLDISYILLKYLLKVHCIIHTGLTCTKAHQHSWDDHAIESSRSVKQIKKSVDQCWTDNWHICYQDRYSHCNKNIYK